MPTFTARRDILKVCNAGLFLTDAGYSKQEAKKRFRLEHRKVRDHEKQTADLLDLCGAFGRQRNRRRTGCTRLAQIGVPDAAYPRVGRHAAGHSVRVLSNGASGPGCSCRTRLFVHTYTEWPYS